VFAAQPLVPQIILGRLLCQLDVWHARKLSSVHDDSAYGICYCMYYHRWMPAFCRIGNSTLSTRIPCAAVGTIMRCTSLHFALELSTVVTFLAAVQNVPLSTRVIGARNDGLAAVFYC
jgi:hypothetical protein